MQLVPSRNLTSTRLPSGSLALTASGTGCDDSNTRSFVGLAHCTVGGRLGGSTVILKLRVTEE